MLVGEECNNLKSQVGHQSHLLHYLLEDLISSLDTTLSLSLGYLSIQHSRIYDNVQNA